MNTGNCLVPAAVCDHFNPDCGECGAAEFCGSDCQCHSETERLPDLYLDIDQLGNDLVLEYATFPETSCDYKEGNMLGV